MDFIERGRRDLRDGDRCFLRRGAISENVFGGGGSHAPALRREERVECRAFQRAQSGEREFGVDGGAEGIAMRGIARAVEIIIDDLLPFLVVQNLNTTRLNLLLVCLPDRSGS